MGSPHELYKEAKKAGQGVEWAGLGYDIFIQRLAGLVRTSSFIDVKMRTWKGEGTYPESARYYKQPGATPTPAPHPAERRRCVCGRSCWRLLVWALSQAHSRISSLSSSQQPFLGGYHDPCFIDEKIRFCSLPGSSR